MPDPAPSAFLDDVIAGLSGMPKSLPPKWFYDHTGAELFEAICELPEYYLTRTENEILEKAAPAIAEEFGAGAVLMEYGSGSMSKVRLLLDRMERPHAFVAVDISAEQLERAARGLDGAYPDLEVHTYAQDFTQPFHLPGTLGMTGRRCAFFPGSTIGNFERAEARVFLERVCRAVEPGGALLIGVDLIKDTRRLEAAYDDAAGITAKFNKNVLVRINRELGGDADLDAFIHLALFNEVEGRIEMHLQSARSQTLTVAGHQFRFEPGETIHTENSYKYTVPGFQSLAKEAGFTPAQVWTDPDQLFAVHLFDAA